MMGAVGAVVESSDWTCLGSNPLGAEIFGCIALSFPQACEMIVYVKSCMEVVQLGGLKDRKSVV